MDSDYDAFECLRVLLIQKEVKQQHTAHSTGVRLRVLLIQKEVKHLHPPHVRAPV